MANCKHDIELTALSTYCVISGGKNGQGNTGAMKKHVSLSSKAKMLGSKIVAGVSVVRQIDQIEQNSENCDIEKKLLLIVYQLKDISDKNNSNKQETSNTATKKSSSSTLSTIEERFEDDEFMKFLASETDLQQLQLLEDYIDNIDTTTSSEKIAELACKNLFSTNSSSNVSNEESKNDDQKISKLKAFNHMSSPSKWAWSQNDSIASSTSSTVTVASSKQEQNINPENYKSVSIASEKMTSIQMNCGSQIQSSPVQFVSVVPFLSDDYEIDEIIPSCDTKFLLVVLRRCTQLEGTSFADDDMETDIPKDNSNVQLILYSIEENGMLDEVAVCVRILEEKDSPLEFCMLPKYEGKRRVFEGPDTENGIFAMTCVDGSLKIISLSSLKTISEAKVDTGNFVSVTYCKSLERICACTDKGSLHFYSFYEFDADSSDDRDDDQCFSNLITDPLTAMGRCSKSNIIYDAMPSTSSQTPLAQGNKQESELIAYKNNLTLNDLKILYSLTLFEELPLTYNAEVPGCWSELIQAQKQRRHPNHLRPGDDSNLTRTWRLHNDATTWDEHLIELNVPKSVTQTIGHIDFKFSLYQPCTNPPAIQVTLLKQKSLGICSRRKIGSKSFDENSDMNSGCSDNKDSCENPVLSDEFLQARSAEILVGPIELSSCMDLSEQGGVVTLTSPKLLKTKSRNFLLHIKTVADMSKDGQGKTRGCDWLHEISITVRAAKHIHKVPNERIQRLVMLESNQLLDNLLKLVATDQRMLMQNLAFDILNWISSIRLMRYRSPIPTMCKWSAKNAAKNPNSAALDPNEQQNECAMIIGNNLGEIVKNCMVLNNRSIAHKCSKLILASLDGAQNLLHADICQAFEEKLKTAIVNALPHIIRCEHAGALKWFTLLISGTSALDSQNEISEQSIKLLIEIAGEMVHRYNPLGLLLRSRFGLYGLPFEPELFDAELPNLSKSGNLIYTYVPATKPGIQVGNQPMDLKSFCVSDGSELRVLPFQLRRKGIGSHFKGALEVEPLHFICTGTSEATRLENTDSAMVQSGHIIDDIMLETPINNLDSGTAMTSGGGSKKETGDKENLDDDMMNNVKNILVDKIIYSAIKKNKLKEEIKEAAKSFDLEVSVLSGYNEPDTNDEWGPPEPRVVFLTNNSANNENSDGISEDTTTTSASLTNKIQEFFEESNANEDAAFQWHKILSTPPKQTIVVDRMHSGARRYVILDFGQPTMLTDLIIPAYPDLASISIDIWCFEEEADSVRLVVSQDIGAKSLVLSDLQPPPICRYLKITLTGRYGMTGTRCKIPMGAFFGHVVIVEKEGYADPVMKYMKNKKSNTAIQLKVLNALFEDVHCRYCLSSSKLSEYLQPFLNNETSNMSHMQAFLNKNKESDESNQGYTKIYATYEECIYFQYQLNLIKRVIDRIESISPNPIPMQIEHESVQTLCTDKLRVLSESLIEILLHCIISNGSNAMNDATLTALMNQNVCSLLFETIIVSGDTHTQLATCSLLVRLCGAQPWWGDFIASNFNKLYSSKNTQIFPQDRIFFLLTYLGRKSISMGVSRTRVIDSILKAIAELLVPLSTSVDAGLGIWPNTDLTQLSWLLLFLSVCSDDGTEKKDTATYRWDFMSGEGDMAKSRLSMCSNNSRTFSRSFKKRYIQNKTTTTSHLPEKYYISDALNLVGNGDMLTIKQQADHLKKLQNSMKGKLQSFGDYFNEITTKKQLRAQAESSRAFQSTSTQSGNETPIDTDTVFDKGLKTIKTQNIIVVIRGLIGLILNMDFTCNMDLFLLTCKIIARLVIACRPSIQLTKIITSNQLLQLLRIAVWENQQQPWAVHAISCLLQDILDADKNYKNAELDDEGMEVDAAFEREDSVLGQDACSSNSSGGSSSVAHSSSIQLSSAGMDISSNSADSIFKPIQFHNPPPPATYTTTSYADAVKGKLPCLMECEDTEMDELLDNLLEREKLRNKKEPVPSQTQRSSGSGLTILYRAVSSAMDARLEHGLDMSTEITLRRLTMRSSVTLFACLPQNLLQGSCTQAVSLEPESWPSELLESWASPEYNARVETNTMLVEAFDNIFYDLNLKETWLDLEKIMQLWLTLNGEVVEQTNGNGFGHNAYKPKIPFGERAMNGLLKTLATSPIVKLRTWCLGFQCLIMACKPPVDLFDSSLNNTQEKVCRRMGQLLTEDVNFERVLVRFFSGTDRCMSSIENSRYAGPTICKLLVDQLVKELLKYTFDKNDLGVAMNLIQHISQLVYTNIANEERIYCKKSSENGSTNNVFGSLFATVLGSESSRHCKTVTDNTLHVSLLKLSLILIKTKIPRPGEEFPGHDDPMSDQDTINESQTDEIKAEQQGFDQISSRQKIPCFADTILQHSPTMNRLLSSLSGCSNSSFAMLVASSLYTSCSSESKNAISEPQNVADAVFQLLIALTKTATQQQFVVKPLYDFLSSSANQAYALPKLQLSEPFLWFILKVLESPESVITFAQLGGVRVLCQSLVRSNRSLINSQPSLVSMIMQHISRTSGSLQSNLTGTIKKSNVPAVKNEEGLINFAPYCTISSDNPTAQPADVLIQNPIASHRRARTPAWTYLFYPNESHVDLTITLPAAILLKEIQLQPHVSTLASCPSAVAVEITRDNNLGPIPISQPIATIGMTCIRLKFNQPEIATSVVIRLYRPTDSTNMGLTQILVLGSTTFSENANQPNGKLNEIGNSDDELQSKSSLGWLRILSQCFNVATFNAPSDPTEQNLVISQAAEVTGFLEACVSLLSVPCPNPNYAISNLETVLLKLGLYSRDLGLQLIDSLLGQAIPQSLKHNNDAVSDLLYILCTTQDNYTRDRIETMLRWVEGMYQHGDQYALEPVSGHIKCLASVLWQAYAITLIPDLPNMITKSLFESLYKWRQSLDTDAPMQKAIDSMLCSVCCIRPELFTILLRRMNVLVPNLSNDLSASISDDRKEDAEPMSEDTNEEWYSHLSIQDLSKLDLTSAQLNTISMACQSPLAIQLLIDSGLPALFTSAILEFCHREMSKNGLEIESEVVETTECLTDSAKDSANRLNLNKGQVYPMVNVIKITEILNFFGEICAEGTMRDWLGSYEGSVFWEPLLNLLCNSKIYSNKWGNSDLTLNSVITPQPYLKLEESVINFMSKVTSCHPKNQETFTNNLIYVIRKAERKAKTGSNQSVSSGNGYKNSISGFTRRLVLQILLESEKILVSVRSELPLQKKEQNGQLISHHPSKRPNSHHLLFYLSTNVKCHEVLDQCGSVYSNLLPSLPTFDGNRAGNEASGSSSAGLSSVRESRKELFEIGLGMGLGMEFLSVAAGVTAKDKRLKEAKNQAATLKKDLFSVFKMKIDDSKSMSQISDFGQLVHNACPDFILSNDTTISQILAMLKANNISLSTPCINLTLVQGRKTPPCSDEIMRADDDTPPMKAADFVPLPSPLQIFSSRGGLSLLAHYLPTVYPETPKSQIAPIDKDKSSHQNNDWVKVEPNEEIYEDLDDTLTESSSKLPVITSVPQHSLAAFGLFLKLPAYSEVLLRDKIKAQCLLRLILGVTGDGEGNEIYSLALSTALPTLPFEVFRQLLDSSPLTTDDGVLLRRMVIEVGAIHLVLNCLGIFTHHTSQSYQVPGTSELQPNVKTASSSTEEPITLSDDKGHMYWAKGTGFGTGSTQQSWNVEQALLRQKSEEEHVTVLLQVLSSYINPGDKVPSSLTDETEINYRERDELLPELPPIFLDLLQQSCLIAALSSYLRNDSVLDITRHIPLYRAILQLLRAISLSNQLVSLLMMRQNGENRTSIATLLSNMKCCVDTYASRLRIKTKAKSVSKSGVTTINVEDGEDEGLALLIPDIQETFMLVQNATSTDMSMLEEQEQIQSIERPSMQSIEEKYLELMKKLQFDTFEMIAESDNGFRFTISHHFETNVRMAGDRGHPARVKRLAQETVTLSTSLPLSYSSSVFVRCDTDRLDIMKVLITGPADTPYANGCFEFDVYFPPDYPNSPMMINLETTGRNSVRFNPNLYNDGKVCLSVLNTWHGRPEEKWNAQTSSFLQVLVSIQSLILVGEPYFNEPGFERSRGTPAATHSSKEYNSNIYQATVRWAMLEQLKNPCPCFKEVIHTHFWLKRNEICTQIENWITELSKPQYSERNGRTISFNSMVLRRNYRQLREELSKLPPPPGLEEMNNPFSVNATTPTTPSNSATASGSTSMSQSQQMSEMDFMSSTSPKMDGIELSSVSSTLLNDALSQHVLFNNVTGTGGTTTATTNSTTLNSVDEDGASNESGNNNLHHMNHNEGGASSGESSTSSSKDQITTSEMICKVMENQMKNLNQLDNLFALDDADCKALRQQIREAQQQLEALKSNNTTTTAQKEDNMTVFERLQLPNEFLQKPHSPP
uniref:CSON002646 protein n=1 Tax=Culicoides sonorensis TaxID=179676 RepID=A0A336MXH4_CULSO